MPDGAPLEDFHNGLATRVGEPHADIALGMEKEHQDSGDADTPFTTSNYGITTSPRAEWLLVVSGGKDRRNPKSGDVRVLREIDYYEELERVKSAGLTRPEIIAVVLYTGPMFQVSERCTPGCVCLCVRVLQCY